MNVTASIPSSVDRTLSVEDTTATDTSTTASTTSTTDGSGTEQTFLQLLVAQLKNQDPMNPADGMQFVTELAQFSQLEQSIAMRQDLDTLAGTTSA